MVVQHACPWGRRSPFQLHELRPILEDRGRTADQTRERIPEKCTDNKATAIIALAAFESRKGDENSRQLRRSEANRRAPYIRYTRYYGKLAGYLKRPPLHEAAHKRAKPRRELDKSLCSSAHSPLCEQRQTEARAGVVVSGSQPVKEEACKMDTKINAYKQSFPEVAADIMRLRKPFPSRTFRRLSRTGQYT